MRDCADWDAACVPNPQRTYVIPAAHLCHSRDTPTSFPRRRESGRGLCPQPAGHRPRVLPASVSLSAILLRLPCGAGAEDGGACGDEEAAGKEEHEQQAA